MRIVIRRSVCCGMAAAIAAMFIAPILILLPTVYTVSRNAPMGGGEVGWDLVTLAHQPPRTRFIVPVVAFAIGFGLGFRSFSKSLRPK
jgi:hypothetical protein